MTDETYSSSATVTLKQVAAAAGVSLATASYAMNDGGSVGLQTRERVKSVAQQLGYRPNPTAKAMRTGKTGALGLVLPDLTNPFFPQLAQSVMVAGRDAGYDIFLTDSMGLKSTEQRSIEALIRRGVDGLVWFPIDDTAPLDIELRGTPTVVLDRTLSGFDCIVADCEAGGRMAAQLLLAAGHQRFGIVSGPRAALSARQRAQGARQAIEQSAQLVWEVESAFSTDLDPDLLQALARREVTAIVAGADLIAFGVIRELNRLGLQVPGDVSVVGFDNITWGDIFSPPLTTIDFPITEMGTEAVQTLLRRIASPNSLYRTLVYEVSVVERASISLASRAGDYVVGSTLVVDGEATHARG